MNKIKYLFMDVDGTLTDGKIYMGNNGEVFKAFHVKDGYAISHMLPKLGIIPVILTARNSEIINNRCKELKIEFCFQGVRNKKEKLCQFAFEKGIDRNSNGIFEEIGYVGDDIIDLECMSICGFSACPKDAVKEVKKIVTYISECNAGEGAVRDIIDKCRNEIE